MLALRLPPEIEERLGDLAQENWSFEELLRSRGDPHVSARIWRMPIWRFSALEEGGAPISA